MPPQTPRSKSTRSGNCLTPSFTFGLGLLPSFKFASPRNLSLLSSISPHRFFNRFSKGKQDLSVPGEEVQPVGHLDTNNADFFDLFSPNDANASFIDDISTGKKFDIDSTADLISTSTGIWSLANDTPNATLNLTSIHEEHSNAKDTELFLSPDDLFLRNPIQLGTKESPTLLSSPLDDDTNKTVVSRKRKLSDPPESPCMLLASQIESYGSPFTPSTSLEINDKSSSKVWTSQLDKALASCYEKYLQFKDKQSPDSLAFKYTSQNKILARMLFNKTGVERTAKQVSSRLLRLTKNRRERPICSTSDLNIKESVQLVPDVPTIMSSPLCMTRRSSLNRESLDLTLGEFTMSFIYKSPIHGVHNFAKLVGPHPASSSSSSVMDVKKKLQIENSVLSSDFDKIAGKLSTQRVPVYSVSSQLNLKPNEGATSTPASPFTNPRLFSIENGNYLCHLKLKVASNVSNDNFLSWKSYICLYKDNNKVLSKSREQINGYKVSNGSFELQVPFLNNFWGGYLTYLSNGSNAFNDLKDIHIIQVIYEGDDESFGTIHGFFSYKFDAARTDLGSTTYCCIKLQANLELDVDDNETVVASSSPEKPPSKTGLSINTALANMNSAEDPMSIPSYDASYLHRFNPNYQQHDSRTSGAIRPVSASAAFHLDVPFQRSPDSLNTPASLATIGGRRQSAGQIMSHDSHEAMPLERQLPAQFMQSIPYVPQGPFPVPVSQPSQLPPQQPPHQPSQQMLPNSHYPIQYAQGMPMMPVEVNEGPNKNMRFDHMGNPTDVSVAPPILGGLVPPQQWGRAYPVTDHFGQAPINSAPASQVRFFPKNASATLDQKNVNKSGPTITFGPILGYDPSKDMKEHTKKAKSSINFHKFLLNPQVMYKPKKK